MITNSHKPKYSYLRRLLFLPLLFTVTFVFALRAHQNQVAEQKAALQALALTTVEQNRTTADTASEVRLQMRGPVVFTTADSTRPHTVKYTPPKLIKDVKATQTIPVVSFKNTDTVRFTPPRVVKDTEIMASSEIKKDGSSQGITAVSYPTKSQATHPGRPIPMSKLGLGVPTHPIYVLNGKIINKEQMQGINRDQIQSVSFLNKENATTLYGKQASDGAVITLTKEYVKADPAHLHASSAFQREFTTVQQEPTYPGGTKAWAKYLGRNLRNKVPEDNHAPAGTYKVTVSFLVDKEGNISEIQAISKDEKDYGTAAEAMRVIKNSGKWIPARQNNHPVAYREKQQIIFAVLKNRHNAPVTKEKN